MGLCLDAVQLELDAVLHKCVNMILSSLNVAKGSDT